MTTIRTGTQLTAAVVLTAIGALLIAEVTDVTTGEWRHTLARGIDSFAAPTWPGWQSAIIGVGLAFVGVVLTAAQFAATSTIAKRVLTAEIEVDDRADLDAVEPEARGRLDTAFWINLGLADMALDIIVVHHPDPPRVR